MPEQQRSTCLRLTCWMQRERGLERVQAQAQALLALVLVQALERVRVRVRVRVLLAQAQPRAAQMPLSTMPYLLWNFGVGC
ncbi:MAG: hypothetical protein ACO22N_03730 [Ilumatobacteraceae bacterium]